MKTLVITRRFPPERCGVGDYASEMTRALSGPAHEFVVVTEPARGARPPHVRVVEQPMGGWRDLPSLLRAIGREEPDWVQIEYSQYAWHRLGCAAWLNALCVALALRGVRVRLGLHEFPLRFSQHPMQMPLAAAQRVHFWLMGLCAGEVCSNTRERAETLARWYAWRREAVRYRPNSNCNPVSPIAAEERAWIRRSRGAADGTLVLATYGLFAAGKNYEAAIEAAIQLRAQADVQLWLLGDFSAASRDYLERLRALAAQLGGRAFWSGPLAPEQVSAHLQAADIFLLPQCDGHLTRSGAFMAAAAHGLPVIAVRNSRNQQEFEHGGNVWLVPSSTAASFTDAIDRLAGDLALRANLGAALAKLYQERFDWRVVYAPTPVASQPIPFPQGPKDLQRTGT